MLPRLQYIGEDTLQQGWQRPTRELVLRALLLQQEGIAPPHAPHVTQAARPAPAELSAHIQSNIAALEAFVNPESGSQLQAVGMAYPQLSAAAKGGSWRIFSAMLGMPDLDALSRRKGEVFVNPTLTPIVADGRASDIEMCFSCLGVAVEVDRWQSVVITSDGREPQLLHGVEARIAQHEFDHLNGILCVKRGVVLYYVPPDIRQTFFSDFVKKKRLGEWPYHLPRDQWRAMQEGTFKLSTYEHLV